MTGFNIIFGHPAIGKTTALQGKYKDRFIDWDVEYNEKRDRWIEEHTKTKKGTKEFKDARNKYLIYPENYPDYIEFLTIEWNRVKNKAKQENKILLVSPHNLLKLFPNDFNYIIDVESSDFISRNINRGGDKTNSKLWKEGIDKTISNVNDIPKYTIKQGVYLSDLLDSANNASKVVDENGEPLVVYHGSNNDNLTIFKNNLETPLGIRRNSYNAIYFANNVNFAENVTRARHNINTTIYSVFLNIKNPKFGDQRDISSLGNEFDGIIETKFLLDRNTNGEAIVWNPNQIKSATDNVGTFNAESDDIRYREVPKVINFTSLDSETKEILTKKGWTEDKFDSIS